MNTRLRRALVLATLVLAFGLGRAWADSAIGAMPFTPHAFTTVASSGTVPVLLVAAVPDRVIIPVHVTFRNSDTVWHTVLLKCGSTVVFPVEVPPGGAYDLPNEHGWIRTATANTALTYTIDSGGTGNTVTVSGVGLS